MALQLSMNSHQPGFMNTSLQIYFHSFGTRQATRCDLLILLKRTPLYGLKTMQYFGSKLWHTLPFFIRIASSTTTFRSKLKTYFIDSYT